MHTVLDVEKLKLFSSEELIAGKLQCSLTCDMRYTDGEIALAKQLTTKSMTLGIDPLIFFREKCCHKQTYSLFIYPVSETVQVCKLNQKKN